MEQKPSPRVPDSEHLQKMKVYLIQAHQTDKQLEKDQTSFVERKLKSLRSKVERDLGESYLDLTKRTKANMIQV